MRIYVTIRCAGWSGQRWKRRLLAMYSECLALPNESDDMHLTDIFSCYYLQHLLFFFWLVTLVHAMVLLVTILLFLLFYFKYSNAKSHSMPWTIPGLVFCDWYLKSTALMKPAAHFINLSAGGRGYVSVKINKLVGRALDEQQYPRDWSAWLGSMWLTQIFARGSVVLRLIYWCRETAVARGWGNVEGSIW